VFNLAIMKTEFLCAGLLCSAYAAAASAAQPALTIYNQNFAVVRDAIPLDLKQGVNAARHLRMPRSS
jgi:hypothetical protein